MIINLVVAASSNNVIGKNNQLLWNLPNDMAFFKNTTWGLPVIMGRKTFDSLGKPLKGRTNILITRNHELQIAGVKITKGLEEALASAAEEDAKQCCVIGGGEIFKQAMPIAARIYITRVHKLFDGDAFFPSIDQLLWKRVSRENFEADARHAYSYSFEEWERNS